VIALLSEKRQEIHLLLTRVIRNSSTADAAVTVLVVVAAVVAAVVVVIVVVVVAAAAAAAAPPRRGWTAAEIQLLWLDLGRDGQVGDAQLAHLPILRRRDGDRAAPSAYRREYDPRHLDPRPWRRRRRHRRRRRRRRLLLLGLAGDPLHQPCYLQALLHRLGGHVRRGRHRRGRRYESEVDDGSRRDEHRGPPVPPVPAVEGCFIVGTARRRVHQALAGTSGARRFQHRRQRRR